MMRLLLALTLVTAACTDVPDNGPNYDSVRDRLTDSAWLYIHDETSSGAITAQRRSHDDWITTTTALGIQRGYVRAALDTNGQLTIDDFEVVLATIPMERVFDRPVQLQDVSLRLAEPVRADVTWSSADEASASLAMPFDVGWAIAFDGGKPFPQVTQRVRPDNVKVVLSGSGDHVEASLEIDATGELWNVAGQVQFTEVRFSLGAQTAD
jgi:hypothetical protein